MFFDEVQLFFEFDPLAVKDHVLALDNRIDVRIAGLCHDDLGSLEFICSLCFRPQPRHNRLQAQTPQVQHAFVGQGGCLVERQQYVAFLDGCAFANHHFLDDAAFKVLDNLVVAGRNETALGNDCRGKRRGCGPISETAKRSEKHR